MPKSSLLSFIRLPSYEKSVVAAGITDVEERALEWNMTKIKKKVPRITDSEATEARKRITKAARRAVKNGAKVPIPSGFTPTSRFEAALVEGMLDVITMESGGEVPGAKIVTVTARKAAAEAAPAVTPQAVKSARKATRLSQAVFAQALNVSSETLKAWEQGKKRPSGAALRLLEWATQHPELVLAQVHSR